MRAISVLGTVIALFVLAGCEASEELQQLSAEERFARAMELFHDEDYLAAIEEFKIVTLQFQGGALADDAQFFIAESYFRREQYQLAAYEYESLIRTMPTSEFVPRARYQRALCYYHLSYPSHLDQEFTRRAIDEFQTFIEYHPADPLVAEAEQKISELNTKLAKKEYENGIIYMKMEYYRAAVNSFDFVLEKYYDSPYAEHAQLKKAEAMLRRKRYKEAKEEIDKFFSKYPNSSLKEEAEKLRLEILSNLSQSGRHAAEKERGFGRERTSIGSR